MLTPILILRSGTGSDDTAVSKIAIIENSPAKPGVQYIEYTERIGIIGDSGGIEDTEVTYVFKSWIGNRI
jgi:hypothetical protein